MQRCDEILEAAALAGKVMLENGAEISRVEQTVVHMAASLGMQECEVFATPTAIVLSVTSPEGRVQSTVRRISQRQTRLDRVEAVNSLSREAVEKGITVSEAKARLLAIARSTSYNPLMVVLASGLGAGAFAVFFGGGVAEFACGLAAGMLLRGVLYLLSRVQPNLFVTNLVGGAVAAACGLAGFLLGVTAGWQDVTVAVIMLMVPGVALTNALRDIAAGELLAGISRIVEAFCIATGLSVGTALVYALAQGLGGLAL